MQAFEEDIEDAVDLAVTTLGSIGRYDNDAEHQNVLIRAGNLGEVWYGDITHDALQKFANVTKHEIVAYDRNRESNSRITVVYPTD